MPVSIQPWSRPSAAALARKASKRVVMSTNHCARRGR